MGGKKTPVPSKTWSCSELKGAHQTLLEVKKESEGEEALKLRIKEQWCCNLLAIGINE